jgi:hypothetical protein
MTRTHLLMLAAVLALLVPAAGCDKSSGGDDDAGKDAAPDASTDAGSDTGSETDTGSESDTNKDFACKDKPWNGTKTYGDSYPDGPYGYKGSVCRDQAGDGTWIDYGDTIRDICVMNQDNEEVCMNDFLGSPSYDVLVVTFSAMW